MRFLPRSGLFGRPGAAGELAGLVFHDRAVASVVLRPGRIFLAGLGLLQGGFRGVDADHLSLTGLRDSETSVGGAGSPGLRFRLVCDQV